MIEQYREVLVVQRVSAKEDETKIGCAFGVLIDETEQPKVFIPHTLAEKVLAGAIYWFRISANEEDRGRDVPWRATALVGEG